MNRKEKAKIEKRLKLMDVLVVTMFLLVIFFIAVMVRVFVIMGSVPDTLIVSTFAWFSMEAGAMAWIKNTKEKLSNLLLNEKEDKNARRNVTADNISDNDNTHHGGPQKTARRPKVQ